MILFMLIVQNRQIHRIRTEINDYQELGGEKGMGTGCLMSASLLVGIMEIFGH